MFNGLHTMPPTDAQLATDALNEEGTYRFPSFSASDAVTLGLSLRKRFRASSRHSKGKGLVISVQSIAGHTLFACTVGDLGNPSGVGDVSLDSWAMLDGMVNVVKRTGHSSFYVEKGMGAMGKTPRQMGIQGDFGINGGAFPIWLENGHCCPIAVVACYSGSSQDDHHLVVSTVKDYLNKLARAGQPDSTPVPPAAGASMPVPMVPPYARESTSSYARDSMRDSMASSEWQTEAYTATHRSQRSPSPYHDHHEHHLDD
ncbi:hypothetical protein PLICRDRAFT_233443 [Plicaturopsis crispa FD-325 SS-3]|nr:hypothetical protein PLICRDRAFT_233443 [Plicaturopsis crispa FD-325 SS-3]